MSDLENDVSGDDSGATSVGLTGWADAMATVLKTGKEAKVKPTLLSKAKKDVKQIKRVKKDTKDGSESDSDLDPDHPPRKTKESFSVRKAKKKERDEAAR